MGKATASIYDVMLEVPTMTQIREFIRRVNEQTGTSIHLSAPSKADLVRSVREAAEAQDIDYEDLATFVRDHLATFVRDHEESGNQHIFLFRPKNSAARTFLRNGTAIAEMLVGERMTDGSLPSWTTEPNEYVWSDFRIDGATWTGRVYGLQVKKVPTGDWEEDGDRLLCDHRTQRSNSIRALRQSPSGRHSEGRWSPDSAFDSAVPART
jgi:hypothetical protein